MSKTKNIIEEIKNQGLLPLYFEDNSDISLEILKILYKSGIRVVEYTNRGAAAYENFKKLINLRNKELPGMFLGIGTIKSNEEVIKFLEINADFIISPGFIKEVADYCQEIEILYIPGCMTPSEIILAEKSGAKIIKLFPGNILGIEFLKSIKELFPNLLFMPTGGVEGTKESISSWFDAGVVAVGMGSKLINKKLLYSNDFISLEKNVRDIILLIKSITNKK